MGSSTENSASKVTRNPWDIQRISEVPPAVQGQQSLRTKPLLHFGTDTGGSHSLPAALCGVVGSEPTYGRVSRYGLVAFASSLTSRPAFTKNVDSATLLGVLSGLIRAIPPACRARSQLFKKPFDGNIRGLELGLPKEYTIGGLDPEVKSAIDALYQTFKDLGAGCWYHCPIDYAVATYYITATAEASANLARSDGVRYGAQGRQRHLGALLHTRECRSARKSNAA